MKKLIAVISALSLVSLVAFQLPVESNHKDKDIKNSFGKTSITDIQKPDNRVLDYDLESE